LISTLLIVEAQSAKQWSREKKHNAWLVTGKIWEDEGGLRNWVTGEKKGL
jgi:hypothetical protein